MFESLKTRLLVYFFIANVLVFVGFSLFIYKTAEKGVLDTIDSRLELLSHDAIVDLKIFEHVNAKTLAHEFRDEFGLKSLELKIIYYNKSKKSIEHIALSNKNLKSLFSIPLNEMGHLYSVYYFDKEGYRISSMFLYENESIKIFLQLATKNLSTTPYLQTLKTSLFIIVPILMLFLLFISYILLSKSINPVKATIDAVNKISADNLSQRLSSDNVPLEIKNLIQTFNVLLQSLEDTFTRISSFSADASHELKTPLTVIRGEAEVSLRKDRSKEEYKQVLEDIIQETVQVQETIEQLFFLTKKDTKELSGNFQELYVDEILSEQVEQAQELALSKSVVLKLEEVLPVTVVANETLFKTVISNLIRNAVNYSEEKGEVKVSLSEQAQEYKLIIEDKGCGISADDLPFIFERFYRVDKSRSRQVGGTGLGLSIVKMILDIHYFTIDIQSVLGVGTKVIVGIPKLK